MALVSQTVKNLKDGMSQQPDILRYPEQGALQVNGWSSETEGLQKRPPSIFVKRLAASGAFGSAPAIHLINRDAVEQYDLVFTGSSILVYDLKGNQYTVTDLAGDGYFNTSAPREDLRIITVADYTFVVNRKKVITMDPGLTQVGYPSLNSRAIINVRGGQYGRTLSIGINGGPLATLVMPDGGVVTDVNKTDAQYIATTLAASLTTAYPTWAFVAGEGYILITAPVGTPINTVETKDGYANQLINGLIYQVQTFSKLPLSAPADYLVEITGEAGTGRDNYWVRYDASSKVWRETVAPGITAGFNASTMPHALVRASSGNFEFKQLTWEQRKVGDDDTNPLPSFVDASVNDVFFYRNRLGFLSGENVIMTRASKFFNFFPGSIATLADDDPIDVAISHNRVSILKYAVPFAEQLLLWSDQAQFVMSSSGSLTSKSLQLDLTTEFDVTDSARPFGIGRGVYFVSPRATYSSIKRYYAVQDVSAVKSAEDVSAQVPRLVPNVVFNLHGSGTENFLSCISDSAPGQLFIYKYLYIEEQVVQQSWGYWNFGADVTILSANSIGSYMWLVLQRPGGITMERVEFTKQTLDFPTEPYRTYMDMKATVVPTVWDEDDYSTSMSLTSIYGFAPNAEFYTMGTEGVFVRHTPPTGGWTDGGVLKVYGDQRGKTFFVGRIYEFEYEFSKFLIKQRDAQGSISTEDSGRLQLRRAWVNYELSGAFQVFVQRGREEPWVYTMSGGRLGVDFTLGELNVGTGQFRFPMSGNAKSLTVGIKSDTPTPMNIIGCGWEGNYLRRTSGV